MEMQLDDLQIELEKVGFVEEYCNGNNQFGKKNRLNRRLTTRS